MFVFLKPPVRTNHRSLHAQSLECLVESIIPIFYQIRDYAAGTAGNPRVTMNVDFF